MCRIQNNQKENKVNVMTAVQQYQMLQLLKKEKKNCSTWKELQVQAPLCCNAVCHCMLNVSMMVFFQKQKMIRQDDIVDWGGGGYQGINGPRGVGESPNEKHTLQLHD